MNKIESLVMRKLKAALNVRFSILSWNIRTVCSIINLENRQKIAKFKYLLKHL